MVHWFWLEGVLKVHGILQSASGRFLSENKGLPDPRLWDVDPRESCSPNVTCIVLQSNVDSSSFACQPPHMASRA